MQFWRDHKGLPSIRYPRTIPSTTPKWAPSSHQPSRRPKPKYQRRNQDAREQRSRTGRRKKKYMAMSVSHMCNEECPRKDGSHKANQGLHPRP
jgi:hypothetical protein